MLSASATDFLAICVLAGMGLLLAVHGLIRLRRMPFTPLQGVLYGLNVLVTRLLWRTRIEGSLHVPPGQGAVIISNHRSPIDPTFIVLTIKRVVHWMVAKEYCTNPMLAWLFRVCEVILVSRGGIDTMATKQAIRYAQNGGIVGLFPEGRLNTTDEVLLSGRPGAAMIALKARVPVVPCYISGSPYDGTPLGCLLMPAKVRLRIGQPIDISEFYGNNGQREVLEKLTKRFLTEIARLGGRENFQPQLAGRFYKPAPANS
ncbi:MAG: lysophospholipid acyltransferase family protein [Planctomycetota bacterium]|jgi:1-acyl-sn-glycerol-3-phosphate acyltransferase